MWTETLYPLFARRLYRDYLGTFRFVGFANSGDPIDDSVLDISANPALDPLINPATDYGFDETYEIRNNIVISGVTIYSDPLLLVASVVFRLMQDSDLLLL